MPITRAQSARSARAQNDAYVFHLLKHELPDADMILYPQQRRSFHRFREIPPEIRLYIWQHAFPPSRTVNIGILKKYPRRRPFNARNVHTKPQRTNEFLSITMFVNHESRTETLKHYCLFYHQPEAWATRGYLLKPHCFSPLRDSLLIHYNQDTDRALGASLWRLQDHFRVLSQKFPKHMGKVKSLTLMEDSWHSCRNCHPAGPWTDTAVFQLWQTFIFFFPSLRQITLNVSRLGIGSTVEEVRDFLENSKAKFGGKTPKVIRAYTG